jgi:hypothetical protein
VIAATPHTCDNIHSMKDVGSQRFQFKTPAEIKEELGGAELF